MYRCAVWAIALTMIAGTMANAQSDKTPEQVAQSVIQLRGAPCGPIMGAVRDPGSGNVVAQCTDGSIYLVASTGDGKSYVLSKRNSVSGQFELYK
jgi:hypothetical protein